jgi:non-specific serine/threonine protein kinase/serine/threonine-protein kinase
MNRERWQQVKQLLAETIAVDDAERAPFLDRACQGDAELRREVESLLSSHHEASTGFLKEPVVNISGTVTAAPARERRLGAYQIAEEIGHGGMGEVHRAVRADGQYTKEVAIKMVRGGFESGSLAERFRNERQILASLDHPNIARLLDGSTTEGGVPYLVMELIRGVPIDQYCDEHGLTVTERLRLFRQVCAAVQYAHQRLVIHRDIKPSNILVTEDGVPKLLDFGLAKLLDPAADAETTMPRAMTPEYASPEQIRGEVITTASDVYSLGVVLYRLLIGRLPYAGDTTTPHQLARAICDHDPARPSTVAFKSQRNQRGSPSTTASISSRREDSPVKLRKRLAGDLDNVVLMALRKDAAQRYPSVEQFSEDIRRHLENIPVLARKHALAYRTTKFIRRHKAGVAAAGAISLLMAGSMAMILRAERRARAQQALAERRFNDVRKLANSLMFEIHDSIETLPGATAARQLIVQRAQEYLDSLAAESKSDPALERELAAAYGRLASVQGEVTYANLGNSEQALKNYRRAVELREAVAAALPREPDKRRELAESYLDLSKMETATEESDVERTKLLEKARALLEPLAASYPADLKIQSALASTLEGWGKSYNHANNWKEAQANFEKALAIRQRLADIEPASHERQIQLAFAHKRLGATLIAQKQLQSALEHYRAALAIDEAELNANPVDAARRYNITFTYSDTGYILGEQGDVNGALTYYRKALAIRKALADADPKDTRARGGLAKTYQYIGELLWKKAQWEEGIGAQKQALSIREALSRDDPTNNRKRIEAAASENEVAAAYAQIAFRPHISSPQRLSLCRQAESLLERALTVFQAQRDQLYGNEADYLTDAQKTADRCSRELSRLKTTEPEVTKAHVP